MHPIHDIDALFMLATALAAKRRPAEPADIVAALDLINNNVPGEDKLSDAYARLSVNGLLCAEGEGVVLSAAAQKIIETLPKKAETTDKLARIKLELADYVVAEECPAVAIAPEVLRAAILAHREAAKSGAKNLLVPKPKPAETTKRPGQRQRKPMPARRRKD